MARLTIRLRLRLRLRQDEMRVKGSLAPLETGLAELAKIVPSHSKIRG